MFDRHDWKDEKAAASKELAELLSSESNQIGMDGAVGSYQRFAATTAEGLLQTPKGLYNAALHNIQHPMEMVKTIGISAGIAATLKLALPEAGPVGKIAGGVMGAWFLAATLPEFSEAYRIGQQAKSWDDMHKAGERWGNAAGHLGVNSALGMVGYKIGAGVSGRVLSSERFDNFADIKQNFWDSATYKTQKLFGGHPELQSAYALQTWRANYEIHGNEAKMIGSEAATAAAEAPPGSIKPLDLKTEMSSMIMLNSKATALKMERHIARMADGRAGTLSDANGAFEAKFGAKPESLQALKSFAENNKLSLVDSDLRSGRVVIAGTAENFQNAFKVQLQVREMDGISRLTYDGRISVPKDLAPHVRAVFGLDEGIAARPAARLTMQSNEGGSTTPSSVGDLQMQKQPTNSGSLEPKDFVKQGGYLASDIAKAQNMPLRTGGEGQNGAFISVSGGIDLKDYNAFFAKHGLEQPKPLNIIEVGRGKNRPGNPANGDVENALDGQIMQTMAPKANISMIIGSNDNRGYVDAFERGIFPRNGEGQNSVLSTSWGLWERSQTKPLTTTLSMLFKQGTIRGVQVFAAAGDHGAGNSSLKPFYQTEYPAADPNVVGVGGLKTVIGENGRFSYVGAWDDGFNSSTGGGISTLFGRPSWQKEVNTFVNATTGRTGRGVPDIATNASPSTGFPVRYGNGQEGVSGGTSASAPLYAGMMLNINAELAAVGMKPVAPLNPWMYTRANSEIFNNVPIGQNYGYQAGKGWNPVTGLGWVDGSKMLEAMKISQSPHAGSNILDFVPRGYNPGTGDKTAAQ